MLSLTAGSFLFGFKFGILLAKERKRFFELFSLRIQFSLPTSPAYFKTTLLTANLHPNQKIMIEKFNHDLANAFPPLPPFWPGSSETVD